MSNHDDYGFPDDTDQDYIDRAGGCGNRKEGQIDMPTYKIIRMYQSGVSEDIAWGLTLKEAQAHCTDPETSSSTCTNAAGLERTAEHGPWFDGWTEE